MRFNNIKQGDEFILSVLKEGCDREWFRHPQFGDFVRQFLQNVYSSNATDLGNQLALNFPIHEYSFSPKNHEDSSSFHSKQHVGKCKPNKSYMDPTDDKVSNACHCGMEICSRNKQVGKTAWNICTKVNFRESLHQLVEYFDDQIFSGLLSKHIMVIWSQNLHKTAGITRLLHTQATETFRNNLSQETKRHAVIEISTKVVDRPERLIETLAHELCHAAQWIIDGVSKTPHGKVFKKWAKRCEAKEKGLKITTCHTYEIEYRFKYECVYCKKIYGRHSRSIDPRTQRCGACGDQGKLKLLPHSRKSRLVTSE